MGSIDIIKALSTVLSNMKEKILGNSENLTRGYWVRSHFFMQPPCYADHSLEQKAFYSLVPYCRDYYNLRNSVKLLVRKKRFLIKLCQFSSYLQRIVTFKGMASPCPPPASYAPHLTPPAGQKQLCGIIESTSSFSGSFQKLDFLRYLDNEKEHFFKLF